MTWDYFEFDFIEYKFYFLCIKMKFQKIVNFLDITYGDKDLPRFVTKNWIEVYDQSEGNYDVNKEIGIKTWMLRSDLCDFNDAYIVAKETITVGAPNNAQKKKIIIMIIIKQYLKIMHHLSIVSQKFMA